MADDLKPAHTLEPWQVRTGLDGCPKMDSRTGYTVERADPTAGRPFVVSTWSRENARLIAAAPELLEALQALTDAVDSEDAWSSTLIDDARAAIAKATGGDND